MYCNKLYYWKQTGYALPERKTTSKTDNFKNSEVQYLIYLSLIK